MSELQLSQTCLIMAIILGFVVEVFKSNIKINKNKKRRDNK